MHLDDPISTLPHTSALTIRRLNSLEIKTYRDLINYFPFRYSDYSKIFQPKHFYQLDELVTARGIVVDFKSVFTKKGSRFQRVTLEIESETLDLVWFNQYYLSNVIRVGMVIQVSGTLKFFGNKKSILVEEYEILRDLKSYAIHTGRLSPVYPEKNGISTKLFREKIYVALSLIGRSDEFLFGDKDFMPEKIVLYNDLMSQFDSYNNIHFPQNLESANKARERLAFDEMFVIKLSSQIVKKKWQIEAVGNLIAVDRFKDKIKAFRQSLPFKLTGGQNRAIEEILSDLMKKNPMNRILQGDVGSGKTVVAAVAAYVSFLNGFKSLVMAPTEILAQQHFNTLKMMFAHNTNIKVCLFTATTKPKNNEVEGADIIVGTHALIAKGVNFSKVGLVIIDEQHKFGVAQRGILKDKVGNPHLLTMTATPIPRTVCLTLYGELDLSVIDEMPPGRVLTKTYLVPPKKRADAYSWIAKQIRETGCQVFIVCPFIEVSEAETLQSVKAVKKEYEYLKKALFSGFALGLLHGKMKPNEKNKVMEEFKSGKLNILVSTSMVEVGVDIPNATIIIVEAAERFGLAQLHQLRGRVGRGDKQAYCLLFTTADVEAITKRLKIFEKVHSGFELAEYDLKLRGAGNIYGTAQHGQANLKIASLSDTKLIEKASKAVDYYLKTDLKVESFPILKKRLDKYQVLQITRD